MGLDIYFNTRKKGAEEESGYTNEKSWELLDKKFTTQRIVRELERENKINTPEYENARKESEDAEKAYDEYEKLNPVQEVAYFRKANFLVSFFDYGEDCSDMEISKDDIVRLQETTKEILDKWRQEFPTLQSENHTKGEGI